MHRTQVYNLTTVCKLTCVLQMFSLIFGSPGRWTTKYKMYALTPSAVYWTATYACVTHRKWSIVRLELYYFRPALCMQLQ